MANFRYVANFTFLTLTLVFFLLINIEGTFGRKKLLPGAMHFSKGGATIKDKKNPTLESSGNGR